MDWRSVFVVEKRHWVPHLTVDDACRQEAEAQSGRLMEHPVPGDAEYRVQEYVPKQDLDDAKQLLYDIMADHRSDMLRPLAERIRQTLDMSEAEQQRLNQESHDKFWRQHEQ